MHMPEPSQPNSVALTSLLVARTALTCRHAWRRCSGVAISMYANGSRYVGQWEHNKKVGHGTFTFEDGSVYDGPFVDDRMAEGKVQQRYVGRKCDPPCTVCR